MPQRASQPIAFAVLLASAALIAAPAEAIKLWEREGRRRAPAQEATTSPTSAALTTAGATPSVAAAIEAAGLLGALPGRGGAPPLDLITRRGDHRRLLAPAAERATAAATAGFDAAASHLEYGNALAARGYVAAAAAEYVAAIEGEPRLTSAWINLSTLLRRGGHADQAMRLASTAVALDPRSGHAQFALALAHEQAGHLEEADRAYMAALDLEPRLWMPAANPEVVGNERAQRALHRRYMEGRTVEAALAADPAPAPEGMP